jgi:hypothetical protein
MKKALWTVISQIPLVGGAAVLWKEVVKLPVWEGIRLVREFESA